MNQHLIQLHRILNERLDVEELRTLCFYLEINYDHLRGEGQPGKARALLEHLDNRRQVAALVDAGKKMRPDIDWPEMPAGQPLQPPVAQPPAPTEAARPLKVFLCHASADKPQVRKLHRQLKACGVQPWLDEEDLLPGQDWQHEIPKAVQAADVVVVCLSQNAITRSGYIQKEIRFALDEADKQPAGSIFLIPVRLEECDVPERLGRWQWVNLYQERGYERLMRALKRRAKTLGQAEPAVPTSRISPWWEDLRAALAASGRWIAGGAAVLVLVAVVVMILASGVPGWPASVGPADGDTWTRPADGMVMVYVPAGQFEMGSTEGLDDEKPVHTISLDEFWIDKYEVNVAQFRDFVTETGYETEAEKEGRGNAWTETGSEQLINADWKHPQGPGSNAQDDHPVVQVTWNDASAYCEWAGARLPSEAEWEYAARGPKEHIYPWGDKFECTKGNFDDEVEVTSHLIPGGEGCDGFGRTAPVGSFPAGVSWCGALDMSGNVWEWTADRYDGNYYKMSPAENPTGPAIGSNRILRGGSWNNALTFNIRCAYRYGNIPKAHFNDFGFRCVRDP